MDYQEALDYISASGRFGIKLGLERTRALLDGLGSPDAGLKGVLVAGTNGKGSTCAMIEAGLRAAGVRTGLYTSPHLIEPTERIRIGGASRGAITEIPDVPTLGGERIGRNEAIEHEN